MRKILKLLGLTCVIICSIFLLYNEGLLYLFGGYNLLRYEYGILFKIPYMLGILLLILIPILLIIFTIKEGCCFKYSFCVLLYMIIVFCFTIALGRLNTYTIKKYQNFSYELWNDKPYVRQIMYKSLADDEKFYTLDKTEVLKKMGVPDKIDENYFIYKTSPGYILVLFNNNKVNSIKYNSFLD